MGNNILFIQKGAISNNIASNPPASHFKKRKAQLEPAGHTGARSLRYYENISKEILELMKLHNFKDVPPRSFFNNNGRGDILAAASTYHGGMGSLRADMIAKGDLKLED